MARGRGPGGAEAGPRGAGAPGSRRADRGQTTIDFLIGIAVFMLVVGFVLGIIPGLVEPFSDSQESTIVADRLATQVAEGMLGEPDRPTVLNETCVNAFFGVTAGAEGEGCAVSFDEDETDLPTRLGFEDRLSVNITVKRLDADGEFVQQFSDGETVSASGPTKLAIGPGVPSSRQSVVSASRTAFIDGKDVTVVVRVW